MGRIPTYEQQVGLSSPEIQSGASPQTAGMVAEAAQRFGQNVSALGEQVQRADVHDDVSNSYAGLSALRSKYTQRIQAETQSGNIDIQKIENDYKDDLSGLFDGINTHEGRNYLQAHGAVLNTDIVKSAAVSQAHVKGKLAVEQYNNTTNLNEAIITSSPSQFQNILRDATSATETFVQNGTMDRVDAEEKKREAGQRYAHAAVIGMAAQNASNAEATLKGGAFDAYLGKGDKESLLSTIRSFKDAEETNRKRIENLKDDAQKKASEAWQAQAMPMLADNTLDPKTILESPMKPDDQKKWLGWQREAVNNTFSTDKAVYNDVYRRIMLDENDKSGQRIVNQNQIMSYGFGKGLSVDDVQKLAKMIDTSPSGKRLAAQRKLFYDSAKAQIIRTDPFNRTSVGHDKLASLTDAAMTAEEQAVKAGKDPAQVYDINSPGNYWSQIDKYKTNASDMLKPSVQTQSPPSDFNDMKFKPGESVPDWKKRTGK